MTEPPDPLEATWSALYPQAMRGPAPGTMAGAVGTAVAAWAAEPDMDLAAMRLRAETLWDRFSTEESALRERLADLDHVPPEAARILAALAEAAAILAAAAAAA